MLTLYTTPLSANGRKVLAVAKHLGLAPEVKVVNVYRGEGRSPAYLAVNPSGQIPTLVDGELVLVESNAILQYLAEAHGNYALSSRDPAVRARIARWLFWEASAWQPTLTAVMAPVVAQKLGLGAASPLARAAFTDPAFVKVVGVLEAHLGGGPFLVDGGLTLADFAVAAMLTYARATELPFAAYPRMRAWYERIEGTEAWRATAVEPWA